jgi:hypothetical protein
VQGLHPEKIFTAELAENAEILKISAVSAFSAVSVFKLGGVDAEPEVVGEDGAGGAHFDAAAIRIDGCGAEHGGVDEAQVGGAAVFIAVVAGGALDAGGEVYFAVVVEP